MKSEIERTEIRFTVAFMLAMGGFLLVLAARTFALEWYEFGTITKALITVTPVVPLFFALWSYVKHYRSMDEFMQRVTGESFLWAIGIVCFLSFGYGLLEIEMQVPHISLAWFLPVILAGSGLARIVLLKCYHEE
jgi:hypothetical protein